MAHWPYLRDTSQILLARFNTYVNPRELIDLSLKGLELLPEVETTFRSLCKINLAHAELMQNNPVEAQKAFEDALPLMLSAGNFLGAVADLFYQARLAFYMGHIDRAEMICHEWKRKFAEMARSAGLSEIPAARGLDIVQSMILLDRNQTEEAERLLVKALELLGWGSWMELHGFVALVRLHHMRGDDFAAQEVLQRMSKLGPQHAACAKAIEVWLETQDSLDDPRVRGAAEAWAKKHRADPSFPFALGIGPYHRDAEYFCNLFWARVQVALGNYEQAATFVVLALQSAKERGLLFRVAELSIAQALLYDGQDNLPAALHEIERALEIAETCGYALFDDSPKLDRLLEQAAGRGIHAQYAGQLLTSLQTMRARRKTNGANPEVEGKVSGLVDPLSERELEILRLLATGLPPAEVAKKLYLSPFTLKAHTRNIYAKLGIHSRVEAINKTREVALL